MKQIFLLSLLTLFLTHLCLAGDITDTELGYSIYLPDNWVKVSVSETQHRFEDTTGTYQSMIVLVRYDFSEETVFETADDWTRANFIAYSFSIEADPFCALIYTDTVTAKQNGTLWATDAFSQFFSVDTVLGDWAEYIRFTASGIYGYEIYALGPADDMATNVGYYVAIIEGISVPGSTLAESPSRRVIRQNPKIIATIENKRFDLLGRMIVTSSNRSITTPQLLLLRQNRTGKVIASMSR